MILSIIIPMYKVEKYIERCLLSTQKQDIPSSVYEVICINDGSPDSSKKIAETIAAQSNNIKVYSQENGGLSSARNTGIDLAKGDYIFFLDSDDWIEYNCLGRVVTKLKEERPDVLCISSCRNNGEKQYDMRFFSETTPLSGPKALAKGLRPEAPFSIVNASFMKENKLRFYEGIFHEDSELTPRMHYLATKISFLNGLIYNYYVNDQSIMSKPNPKKSYDIINVVCPRLSLFCEKIVNDEDKIIFHNLISMYLNNALNFITGCEKSAQLQFVPTLVASKDLFVHLKGSTFLKYRLEGILFTLFPSYILTIYKLLIKLK